MIGWYNQWDISMRMSVWISWDVLLLLDMWPMEYGISVDSTYDHWDVPSGDLSHSYWKWPFIEECPINFMVIFQFAMLVITRGYELACLTWRKKWQGNDINGWFISDQLARRHDSSTCRSRLHRQLPRRPTFCRYQLDCSGIVEISM